MDETKGIIGRKHTILLVDDEPINIRIMSQILKDSYRIMVATGGNEALKCASSSQPPDLILLDMVMPDMDGISVCRELASSDETRDIPVIMVSGKADENDITEALSAGASDCLSKPVHPALLKKRVSDLLFLRHCKRRSSSSHDIVATALEQEKEANMALKATLRRIEQELEASRQYRHMFLAEMHHEIKTHLTTITGMTGLSLRRELSPELFDYITTIETATSTLVELVNDIVDLSMLEEGELQAEYREFSPSLLINEICDACGELAIKKGAELVLDTSPDLPGLIKGSPTRIRQLLTHLVHYTIKWLNGREILLKCSGHFKDNSLYMLEISVSCLDNTLTDSEAKGLLEYVTPLDRSGASHPASAGLGLPICRRIVEKMSGRMNVSTSSDSGITFRCVIPAHCVDSTPHTIKLPNLPEFERLSVLILDDSRLAATTIAGMLERLGFTVETEHDWVRIRRQIEEGQSIPWDMVLIDWSMPGVDGLELARRIRAAGSKVPLIIMGMPALLMMHMTHEEHGEDNHRDGMGFIMKPVKREPLVEKIKEMLSPDTDRLTPPRRDGQPPPALRGLSVLLVEDNAINRQIARQLLEMAGMKVTGVSNGKGAIEAAMSARFDVILMDIELPDINGMEAVRQIKKGATNAATPAIALTAHSWTSHKKAYNSAGMAFCIEKPIDIDELYETIERAVAKGRST